MIPERRQAFDHHPEEVDMKRFLSTLAAITVLVSFTAAPGSAAVELQKIECTDYCGEKAAEKCDRIDGWNCAWYILGCLAGCNVAQL